MLTEGAMADWGGLYLRQDLGASAAVAALAFAFLTGGMTVGRVFGDWLNGRLGPVALLRWGALLTGIPLAAMLLIGAPAAALAGLFAIGLGVSNGVPLMFSAAGRQPDTPPGPASGPSPPWARSASSPARRSSACWRTPCRCRGRWRRSSSAPSSCSRWPAARSAHAARAGAAPPARAGAGS